MSDKPRPEIGSEAYIRAEIAAGRGTGEKDRPPVR